MVIPVSARAAVFGDFGAIAVAINAVCRVDVHSPSIRKLAIVFKIKPILRAIKHIVVGGHASEFWFQNGKLMSSNFAVRSFNVADVADQVDKLVVKNQPELSKLFLFKQVVAQSNINAVI